MLLMVQDSKLLSLQVVGTMLLTILLVVTYRLYRLLRPPRIPGIPSIPDNSILGSTISLVGAGKKIHERALSIAKANGPIYQSRLLGRRLVYVTDKNLIRAIMRDVNGKGGVFHEVFPVNKKGTKKFLNTFNLNTNEEWKLRRNKFRHPFSAANLRNYEADMNALVTKLCDNLDAVAASGGTESVEIDRLFGQLAMDAICKIAFQYNLNGLDDSPTFNKLHTALAVVFQVCQLILPTPSYCGMFTVSILW